MFLNMNKNFDHLFAKSSTGKIKEWWPEVTTENEKIYLLVTSGYADGKKTTSKKEILSKNKGRSNETSPFQQACLDAQSKMNKKMDEGYVLDQAELTDQVLLLPMLAHTYRKRKHDIKWPAIVQTKLNGVRCIATGDKYLTRKGKEYTTVHHLDECVKALTNELGVPLDGELFVRDWSFQEIIRAVKKDRGDTTLKLQYWVYDIVDPSLDFQERLSKLVIAYDRLLKLDSPIIKTPYFMVNSEDEMMTYHKAWTKMGFEGTIIRNLEGKYELKNRSKNLQKYKDFLDDEFEIVGGQEAEGDDAGTVVFSCRVSGESEKTFSVRPKGSRETRARWFTDLDSIIGKQLTVRYQELSEDGIPIFPVGLAVRDYEG